MLAAAYDNWVGLGAGLMLLVLLVVVLIVPERF
ncbi:MAG: K(+)-transporting ATPase subunit F [Acidimicrobiales bacterium]